MYAIHLAKELESKLWSLAACSHLVDVTDEVLIRYEFDDDTISTNRDTKAKVDEHSQSGIKALLQKRAITK